jgi:glycosyltransferase involved in cell wall biosynthesis
MSLHIVGDVYRHDLPAGIGYLAAGWETFSLRLFYANEYFIAICPSTATELEHFGIPREHITVVSGGRREPEPPISLTKTAYPSLVYHGRLKRYKRVDWLIRALPTIRAAVPGARLHIVGDGAELESLKRLAARREFSEAVVFHGQLPDAEHWRVVSSAWVHVQPSLKEGWSLSVMEAAQLGIPTVATRAAGLQDVVVEGKTGLLFEWDDPNDLSSQIIRLLRSEDDRRTMGEHARIWANGYSWQEASLAVEEVLNRRGSRMVLAAEAESSRTGPPNRSRSTTGAAAPR